MGEMMNRPFVHSYECYSVSMLPGNERHDVEKGGKIIMPPSALDQVGKFVVPDERIRMIIRFVLPSS